MGYFYKEIKENLALGFSTEEEIINAWKKSKKHAENLFTAGDYSVGIYTKKAYLVEKIRLLL